MDWEKVTVKCLYCRREMDGYFKNDNKQEIINMENERKIAVVGEWNKRKGYLHVACKTGIDAEEALQGK